MAFDKPLVVSWNIPFVKKLSKEKFLKTFKHLADDKKLTEEYDKVVKPKDK